jgi:hypothetical protein
MTGYALQLLTSWITRTERPRVIGPDVVQAEAEVSTREAGLLASLEAAEDALRRSEEREQRLDLLLEQAKALLLKAQDEIAEAEARALSTEREVGTLRLKVGRVSESARAAARRDLLAA